MYTHQVELAQLLYLQGNRDDAATMMRQYLESVLSLGRNWCHGCVGVYVCVRLKSSRVNVCEREGVACSCG